MNESIKNYVERINEKFGSGRKSFNLTMGRKYAKVVESTGGVYAFIEIETGGIFKPAGWSAPAKHVRGNVNDASGGMDCSGPYSIQYLRG